MIPVKTFENGAQALAHAQNVARRRWMAPKAKPAPAKPANDERRQVYMVNAKRTWTEQHDAHVIAWKLHIARRGAPIKAYIASRATDMGLTYFDIVSESRRAHLIVARRTLCAEVFLKFKPTLPEMGRAFKRDHTTILHHLRVAGLFTTKEAPAKRSGVRGIRWKESHKSWVVEITVSGKTKFLGYHKELDDAKNALLAFLEIEDFPPNMRQVIE